MAKYLAKKAIILISSLFVVATLTFALMHNIPGDPFTQEKAVPKEILQAMVRHYGLDDPWYLQYARYLKGLITFDLGPSFKYQGRSVSEIIFESFPVSLQLGMEALLIALFLGTGLGCIASLKQTKWQDHFAMLVAVLWISVPSFIFATFLQYIFCLRWELLPVARWGAFQHSILPAISLAALPTAFIARLVRANMIETLHQDFIQTAKSKGLSSFQITIRHILRNSLLPVVAYLGPLVSSIFTGSFAVEKVFGIPGLGQWFITSIINRDYTVIMGVTIFYSAILMVVNFLIDIFYGILDPRIRIIDEVQ
ncbi:MAG: ABC transporter permease [Chlamydiae bacterium]|nr:ABC transporter permease [Chlamydiota bacterium]